MDFQWYPGHMTKAKRMMQENMKLIDIMIELVDARIPLSSRNPDIDQLAANKSRLILLNKTDMADERVTAQWEEPSDQSNDRRNPKRWKINIYQQSGWKSLYKNRK